MQAHARDPSTPESRPRRPATPPVWTPPPYRPVFKRRPGPRQFTKRRPPEDEWDDPIRNLRYESEITTRDVASLLSVTPATVRRWVARGYISPVGKLGPSNLFSTREVLAAYDDIKARRKATAQGRRTHGYLVELRPIDKIRPKHYDAVVDVSEAARLIQVSPSTIRSWIHRGHLKPLASSQARATQLRLGDVIAAAHARELPRPAPFALRRRRRLRVGD
ncbi:helix-turn-helix domain-containing protein [Georgenia soli]|uniref:helix-turn-helix domain-containing protein n=1 Tax=Georgenia soli TaxID=638953 RepID=UPI003CCC3304